MVDEPARGEPNHAVGGGDHGGVVGGAEDDGAANTVHAVDLTTGEIVASAELDVALNEIAVATG